MPRLTAEQIISLNILTKENNCDDSCDESEIDLVEGNFLLSESDEEDKEEAVEMGEFLDRSDCSETSPLATKTSIGSSKAYLHEHSGLTRSNTVEMITTQNIDSNNIIYGRVNTVTKIPFEWYEKPNQIFEKNLFQHAKVIELLQNEKSIEFFFEMVNKIAKYTNKRISLINNDCLENLTYREHRNRLENVAVTAQEIYSFIGILILLGITKKSDVSMESLWKADSLHYAPFAVAVMSRERFQLLSRNITFDDLDERVKSSSHKFYKISEIFNDFKENLPLLIPSSLLCVDEELYAFRGFFLNFSIINLLTSNLF